ncbi:hypothetical protein SCUP234_06876 [Seiridium cupressi]
MIAKSAVTVILSFCSALGIAAPVTVSYSLTPEPPSPLLTMDQGGAEGSIDPASIKERAELYWASTLLADGKDDKKKRDIPLYWASTLLTDGADDAAVKEKRDTPLYWASTLLTDGEKDEKKRDTPLYWASTLLTDSEGDATDKKK